MGRQSNRKRHRKAGPNDGKQFERLTAALHHLKHVGADVRWNDRINGRQVDVSVRFKQGSYTFLIIIECRDLGRAVEVGDVEAFVTKSRSLKANLGVMVSGAGFQQGAKTAAVENHIELFTLSEVEERLPSVVREVVTIPTAQISHVRLTLPSGETIELSNQPDYLSAVTFTYDGRSRSLATLFKSRFVGHQLGFDEYVSVELTGNWVAILPEGNIAPIVGATARLRLVIRPVSIAARMPPEITEQRFEYANVLTGDVESVRAVDMPFGFDTEWAEGAFYRDSARREYLCVRIADDGIHMRLLNSIQHGRRVFADAVMFPKDKIHYVRITEPEDVQRLEAENSRHVREVALGIKKPMSGIVVKEKGAIITRGLRLPPTE